MYEAFYGLKEKPFSIQPDPDFLYFSSHHQLAYSMLEYGVHDRAGFIVITGEVGCGKTTLLRYLLNNLDQDIRVGLISNTKKDMTDPLEWVMLALDQPYTNLSKVALFDAFQAYLIDEYASGRHVILIIDEAQNLCVDAIESLRMLSNINADKDYLLQMILVGQPQLKSLLSQPQLEQFVQRVSVDFQLKHLRRSEVGLYVLHRLKTAGSKNTLFSPQALGIIADITGGIPRNINILCDTALLYGFSMKLKRINSKTIKEVIQYKKKHGVLNRYATTYPRRIDRQAATDSGLSTR